MIPLAILFGLYVLASGAYLVYRDKAARSERRDLENRLMAMAKPEALITHRALEDSEPPSDPFYVDEGQEAELQGIPDLVERYAEEENGDGA